MSDAREDWSDAVAALVRKSRVSLISTLLILAALGGSIVFLSFQIFDKRQELKGLNDEKVRAMQDIDNLRTQIEQKKAELNQATQQAREAAIKLIVKRLRGDAHVSNQAVQQAVQDALQTGRLVYLQYSDKTALGAMKRLQNELVSKGYVAPGIEAIDPSFLSNGLPNMALPNVVRYFRAEDRQVAQAVVQLANESFARSCPNGAIKLEPELGRTKDPKSATQLEVWMMSGCGARRHGAGNATGTVLAPRHH